MIDSLTFVIINFNRCLQSYYWTVSTCRVKICGLMSDFDQFLQKRESLEDKLEANPNDWEVRKELAHLLYNQGHTKEAANLVWRAPEIPSVDLEIAFAAKVLGKGKPAKAIRLLTEVQRLNQGKAVQNLGLANALLHHGMVMQAARFYGAAIELDPDLVSPDIEHFLLWIDDTEKMWGDFDEELPKLEELPWIKRSAEDAEKLKKSLDGHTTPISIPGLQRAAAEEAMHSVYVQSEQLKASVTPPPAVTIPMDRVKPEHVVIDNERGAGQPMGAKEIADARGPVSSSTGASLPQGPNSPQVTPSPLVPPGGQTVRAVVPTSSGNSPAPLQPSGPPTSQIPTPRPTQSLVPPSGGVVPATGVNPQVPSPRKTQPLVPGGVVPPAGSGNVPVPSPRKTQPLIPGSGQVPAPRKTQPLIPGGSVPPAGGAPKMNLNPPPPPRPTQSIIAPPPSSSLLPPTVPQPTKTQILADGKIKFNR